MWFDPSAIGRQSAPPLATFATPATFDARTGEQGPKVAEVAEVADPGDRWRLHFSDREPLTVACCPAATRAEVLAWHPGAVAAEPFTPTTRQPSAPMADGEESMVMAWLAQIGETDPATVGEVVDACRRDEDARRYFLGRAAQSEEGGR